MNLRKERIHFFTCVKFCLSDSKCKSALQTEHNQKLLSFIPGYEEVNIISALILLTDVAKPLAYVLLVQFPPPQEGHATDPYFLCFLFYFLRKIVKSLVYFIQLFWEAE